MLRQDDLVIPQGTTWAIRWPIQTPEGALINTNGWTVKSHIRFTVNDEDLLYEWSSEAGNASIIDSYIELRITPEESSEWRWGRNSVVYDVEVTTNTGEIIRVTQGKIKLSAEVTR